jgi:hypothetical protein
MSTLAGTAGSPSATTRRAGVHTSWFEFDRSSPVWPMLVSFLSAVAFYVVRPNVGDLQAALARQSAAAHGVGLTYWFQWFGGGAAPGNYSVVVPYLSSLVGAPMVGAIATVAITPLAWRALADTPARLLATWVAAYTVGLNLWSGRIPFALGLLFAVVGLIGVRERRPAVAVAAIVASSLCSPVTGVFLAFGLGAAFLVEQAYRKLIFWVCATCGAVLVFIEVAFGNPGQQTFIFPVALLTSASALVMLFARPALPIRVTLWCTGIAAIVLGIVPNGMGSNFERLPWIILPVAVVATATAPRLRRVLAVLPALALCCNATVFDLVHASNPSASTAYYKSLITQLDQVHGLQNYRVEVIEHDPRIHTAAYALLGHAALAGGYETQEQNTLNAVLADPKRLNSVSYKLWLDNNAVGYVALNNDPDGAGSPEYNLVDASKPGYLDEVDHDAKWTLYRVANPTPIVAAPESLVKATQASLEIRVPCACSFSVRVRYSHFLEAKTLATQKVGSSLPPISTSADIRDDGSGWTIITTEKAGDYLLRGEITGPFSR